MLPPRHPKVYDMTKEPGFLDDSTLAPGRGQNDSMPTAHLTPSGVVLDNLTEFDVKVLRRSLKRLRFEAKRDNQRNKDSGWKPEPGKHDVMKMTLDAIDNLMARLPFPGDEARS